ncbi:MAG: Gfo/Idh/MocA family oxidoreductase [Variovorax sp.]|nr:Gfo/Idh/MocA family oxidoreductase [Variovorax sp.]
MTIRIAAIGTSHWHALNDPAYLRQLARMPDVQLVGLHDDDLAVAQRRSSEVGGPPAFVDHRQMLDDTRPDFIIALGRHDRMAGLALELLDRGLPFLMEKPMGLNAREVERVAIEARKRRAFVAVPMPQRFSPFWAQAQRLRAADAFGPLSHMYVRMNRFTPKRYPAWDCPWMLDPTLSGGGCLRNLGAHAFDMMAQFTEEEPEVVAAQVSHLARCERVEDFVTVMLRTPSGVLGTIEIGYAYPRLPTPDNQGPGRDKLLDGADGEWKVAGRDALLMAKDGMLRIVTRDAEHNLPGDSSVSPSFQLLRDALDRWQRGEAPLVGVEDCLRAARLTDDAYRLAGVMLPN